MPHDTFELDFMLAPDDAAARALAEARLRRLRRRRPGSVALALTPEPGARALGAAGLEEEQAAGRRMGELLVARREQASRAAAERRADEQLRIAQAQLGLARQQAQRFQPVATPSGVPLVFDPRAGTFRMPSFAPAGGPPAGGPQALAPSHAPRPGGLAPSAPEAADMLSLFTKPLTEDQGKASQQLALARTALTDVRKLGRGVLPTAGVAGAPEAVGQMAREWLRMPQLLSPEQQLRHSALRSVAEPIARALTGAQAPRQEMEDLVFQMVPMPGESRQEQLAKLRRLVENAGAAMGRLPPSYAQEHAPFFMELREWVGELAQEQAAGTLGGRRVYRR